MKPKKLNIALMLAAILSCACPAIAAENAVELEAKLAQQEQQLGPEHTAVALSLNNLALVYQGQGRYADIEPLYKRALAIFEKQLGSEHVNVAGSLYNLAGFYKAQGRYGDAEPLYKRSLAIWEKQLGAEHPNVALNLNNLAELYRIQGRYADAEPLYKRSLAIREKRLAPEHPDIAESLNNLAALYQAQGRYADAGPLFKRAVAIWEKRLGPEHPEVARGLNNLAETIRTQGRYADAEPLYKRALAIWEKRLGPEHPDVAISLNNLALLYQAQGRYADAEPLFKRTLAIREKQLGSEHSEVAQSLNNLAVLYQAQGRYAEAESLLKRALAIWEKWLGPEHLELALGFNNLASLYQAQGRYADAEPMYRRALAIRERRLGPEHSNVATSLNNLASLYQAQGRHGDAEPLFKRALAIWEKQLGPEHPNVAQSLNNLAWLYRNQDRSAEAISYSRQAFQIYRTRFVKDSSDSAGGQSEKQSRKERFIDHLSLLAKVSQQSSARKPELGNEAFEASQLAQASGTGDVVAKMAARFAAGTDTLAQKARERQDRIARLQKLDADLVKASSLEPAKRNPALEQQLRNDLASVSGQIAQLDKDLAANFPEYAELTAPKPLGFADVQKLLKPDEALLAYTVAGKASYLFVLRSDKAEFIELAIGGKDLNSAVQHLRQRLDPGKNDDLLPLDVQASYELYQKILAPAEPYLAGARNVMLVQDGALQSLPFGVLVSALPKGPIIKPADHRQVAWLARRYAFTTLPSVSALRALRIFAKGGSGNQPFIGFGDPLLQGGAGKDRSIVLDSVYTTHGVANVDALRKAPRLPETADELKAMARTLKTGENRVYLQDRATETTVKAMDLSNFRTIAFATHGVMAGELKGMNEPGLVLTPPQTGTILDDGYLSTSEIAQLKLNADWVLLSACNTAAPDGTPGAEGLSGLAKAFFYAGARTLLVSHWPVDSDATKELQTTLLREYAGNPGAGKAQALRRAALTLMDSKKNPEFAHPMFWAPFVVAGEGGADAKFAQDKP